MRSTLRSNSNLKVREWVLNKCFHFCKAMCVVKETEHLAADGHEWKPFECEIPGDNGYNVEMVNGVFQVSGCRFVRGHTDQRVNHPYPCIEEFMEDQKILLALSTHGPV